MHILIEEHEIYDMGHGDVYYKHDNIGISESFGNLLEYCRENYLLSDADYEDLCKYKSVDDVYDRYGCSVNLIINVVNYI